MVNIHHRSILDTKRVCELYSAKDGVPVTYVCTSALGDEAQAMDIFYRETPHTEFGNRYFGLYEANNYGGVRGGLVITNADKIEDAEFGMKEYDGEWHYSQHRHDFYTIGDVSLDGGRAYFRCVGNVSSPTKWLVVRNGEFAEKTDD
jgi:hypothetical protein